MFFGKKAAPERRTPPPGFTDAHALPARTPLSGILPSYLREALAVLYYWCFRRVDGGPLQGVVGLMALQKRFFYK